MENIKWKTITQTIFSILFSPIFFPLLLISYLYRCLIYLVLLKKHGKRFNGFLQQNDSFWACTERPLTQTVLLFVNYPYTTYDKNTIVQNIKNNFEDLFKKFELYPKLSCSVRRKFGYPFLLKGQVAVDDCISTFSDESSKTKTMDMKAINKYLNKFFYRYLPRNNEALIEILVGEKPAILNETTSIAIIFRFNRILADDFNLIHLIISGLSDEAQPFRKSLINFQPDIKYPRSKVATFIDSIKYLSTGCLTVLNYSGWKTDQNILSNGPLTGQKIFVWKNEDIVSFVPKIESLKKRMEASSDDVLLTVIAASLATFVSSKDNTTLIRSIKGLIIDNNNRTFHEIFSKKINLTNNNRMGIIDLPIHMKNQKSLVSRLEILKSIMTQLKQSRQIDVNYWTLSVLAQLLPQQLANVALNLNHVTFSFSNLPNIQSFLYGGQRIEDIIYFPPNRNNIGISFGVNSYENRLTISLTADRKILLEPENGEAIIEGIFRNMVRLFKELEI